MCLQYLSYLLIIVAGKPVNWLERAKIALAEGNSSKAAELLSRIDSPVSTVIEKPSISTSSHKKVAFRPGLTTETDLMPLTPYWNEHMWKLDIHIPLTIFNVDWINRDLLVAVKHVKKSKEKITGQLPWSEWWMSYSDWTRPTRLFLRYLREVYQHADFANALVKFLML